VISIELIISLLGLSLGSFVTACAYRIPRQISVVSPRSFCPECRATLRWYDIIPLLGFVINRGRCRECGARISLLDLMAEFCMAGLAVILFLQYGLTLDFACFLSFSLIMVLIAVIDWQHLIIPNKIIVAGFIVGFIIRIVSLDLAVLKQGILTSLVAAAVTFSILIAGNLFFRKETMGMGDVKLSGLIGFYVGLPGFLISFWIAVVAGAIFGLGRIWLKRRTVDTKIPFGAFLAVSSLAYVLLQDVFNRWIESWLTSVL
jgi:leader peptidase (prepilin peptidase)/N-methyltransferase